MTTQPKWNLNGSSYWFIAAVAIKKWAKPVVHGAKSCGKKTSNQCGGGPSSWLPRVPSQWPLALSVTSVRFSNKDNGGNKVKPEICTDLLTFTLTTEEHLGKSQPANRLKVAWQLIISNEVPYLQVRLVGPHNTSWREGGKGEKKRFIIVSAPRYD